MIKLTPTKQVRGMILSGDFQDLDELVNAVYVISDSDYNEALGFGSLSNILLSLAYDARHAIMGSRDIEMVDNGSSGWNMDKDNKKKVKSISKENLYYSVPITMLTCVFVALLIDTLNRNSIQKCEKLMKVRNATTVLQCFSSKVWDALEEVLGAEEVASLYDEYTLKVIGEYPYYENIMTQFISRMEVMYLKFKTRKERIKYLPGMISDMIHLGDAYEAFYEIFSAEAKQRNCSLSDLQLDYPEITSW